MNSISRLLWLGTALGTVIFTPAVAQTADDEGATPGDIIVTARRVEERLQDVPISITVFQPEAIAQRNIVSAGDLAAFTPSLSTNSRFGAEKTSFAIRGFVQENATGPSVGVYFADAVAPRATHFTGGGNGAGPGALFDLQNIQVLKGPQGTLFGRNTTGGAILMVPVKPKDRLEGYVEGSIGNYDMRRAQAVINVPIADTFKARFGVDRQVRDGYMFNVNPTAGPRRFNDVDYWAFRGSLVADLTPDLENYLIASYSKSNTVGVQQVIVAATGCALSVQRTAACAQKAARDASGRYYAASSDINDQHQLMETWQVINTTTWRASDSLTVKNILSYGQYRENFTLNSFGLSANGFFTVHPVAGIDSIDQETWSEELQFQGSTGDGKLMWQAGGFIERSNPLGVTGQHTQQASGTCTNPQAYQCAQGVVFNDLLFNTWYKSTAVYAQATYKFTDQLSFTGGARYTWDKIRGEGSVATTVFTAANTPRFTCSNLRGPNNSAIVFFSYADYVQGCKDAATTKSQKPTWTGSLEFKPIDDAMLYAKYSRGYRAGGVDLRQPAIAAGWGEEKVDTYELGAKLSFDGAVRGSFNVAAFYNDFSDQQLQISLAYSDGRRASAVVNAGKSTIKGLEVEASLTPLQGLTFDVGYAYLDTELKSYTRPAAIAADVASGVVTTVSNEPIEGLPLFLSPKHKLVATGTYVLPFPDDLGELSISGTYTYTSSQYASYGDTQFAHNGTPALPAIGFDPGFMPSTELVNASLNWKSVAGMPVDLSLFATNLTKEKYPVNAGATYAQIGFSTQILGAPRMYGARLRYRFGN